jgi:hypothetical protein
MIWMIVLARLSTAWPNFLASSLLLIWAKLALRFSERKMFWLPGVPRAGTLPHGRQKFSILPFYTTRPKFGKIPLNGLKSCPPRLSPPTKNIGVKSGNVRKSFLPIFCGFVRSGEEAKLLKKWAKNAEA